jgi:hypothetical protein
MNEYLELLYYALIFLSLFFLWNRFQKKNSELFLDYSTYLLIFGLFYISIPSIVTVSSGISLVGSSIQTIEYAAFVGLYFNSIFLLFFYISTKNNKCKLAFNFQLTSNSSIRRLIISLTFLIALYVVFILAKDSTYLTDIYNNRRLQADYDYILMSVFKIYFLSKIQIILISYLFFTTKKMKYLIYFVPFLLVDILLSGRDLLFAFMLLVFIMLAFLQSKLKIKYMLLPVVALIFIGVIRSNNVIEWSDIEMVLGEFNYTWATTHIIYDSNVVNDWKSMLVYSFFKIFPGGVYQIIFGEYNHYHEVITRDNPFAHGLSGSVISEALSFKNIVITSITPVLIVLYGYLINSLLRIDSVFSKTLFVIAILYIHPIIRFTFYEHIFYPFYLMIFFGLWIALLDYRRVKRI